MSTKKAILMLTVVSLIVAGIAFAAKVPGKVPAPTAFQVLTPLDTAEPDTVEFSWTPTAPGTGELAAIKFSVDVEGLVTYTIDPADGDPLDPVEDAEVEVS